MPFHNPNCACGCGLHCANPRRLKRAGLRHRRHRWVRDLVTCADCRRGQTSLQTCDVYRLERVQIICRRVQANLQTCTDESAHVDRLVCRRGRTSLQTCTRDLGRNDLDVILQQARVGLDKRRQGNSFPPTLPTTRIAINHATNANAASLNNRACTLHTCSEYYCIKSLLANHLRWHRFTSWGLDCRGEGRRRRSTK